MNTSTNQRLLTHFQALYDQSPPNKVEAWLQPYRARAIQTLKEHGFPHKHSAYWGGYADLWKIAEGEYVLPDIPDPLFASIKRSSDLSRFTKFSCSAYDFLFDGVEPRLLSQFVEREKMPFEITSFRHLSEQQRSLLSSNGTFGLSQSSAEPHAFTLLNTAFGRQGVFIHVSKNTHITLPLRLFYFLQHSYAEHDNKNFCEHPRVFVRLEENARLVFVEHYFSGEYGNHLVNSVVDVDLASGASLEHHRIFEHGKDVKHVGALYVRQNADSYYNLHQNLVTGNYMHHFIHAQLQGKLSRFDAEGGYYATGNQYLDQQLLVEHQASYSVSNQNFRGVLDEKAFGVFGSKVKIAADVIGASAKQSNKYLLTSPHARARAKPELEIFTDDVECSHAATVTEPDEAMVRYLQCRGIAEDQAHAILKLGFLIEVNPSSLGDIGTQLLYTLAERMGVTFFNQEDLALFSGDILPRITPSLTSKIA